MPVKPNSTATARLDFDLNHSLHVTGNGKYILAPVIQIETKDDAEVETDEHAKLRISGGTVRTHVEVGTDEHGNTGIDIRIPDDADVSITANDDIKVRI